MTRPLFTACLAACFGVAMLFAANTEAGFFKTITIDSDFSDWADVPVLDDDSGDNFGGPDIGVTKIANDDDFLYIYNSFPNGLELSTFTALDVDSSSATGFDVFGLGLIGSESGWQNDFPFTQDAGTFNNNSGMSGDFFGSGAALTDGNNNTGGARELAISLDILFNAGGSVFADDDFDLLFWTDTGTGADMIPNGGAGDSGLNGDVSAPISYTLASNVPEPTSLLLCVAMGAGCLAARRRV